MSGMSRSVRDLASSLLVALLFVGVLSDTRAAGKQERSLHYEFGSARFGAVVSHEFTLNGRSRDTIARIDPSCSCIDASLVPGPGKGAAVILVRLDTAKAPDLPGSSLQGGDEISKSVLVYLAANPVHPAYELELHGRISYGVALDPPSVNFGNVNEATGASRQIVVTFDSSLFQPRKTALVSTDPAVVVEPVGATNAGATRKSLANPHAADQVRRQYRLRLPAHCPIGLLSGSIRVVGLASRPATSLQGSRERVPAPELPFTGEVSGRISALPQMALFGLLPSADRRLPVVHAGLRALGRRWIRLSADQSFATRDGWENAVVTASSPNIQTKLLTTSQATARGLSVVAGRPNASERWLLIEVLAGALTGPLSDQVIVRFADRESVRVPLVAEIR